MGCCRGRRLWRRVPAVAVGLVVGLLESAVGLMRAVVAIDVGGRDLGCHGGGDGDGREVVRRRNAEWKVGRTSSLASTVAMRSVKCLVGRHVGSAEMYLCARSPKRSSSTSRERRRLFEREDEEVSTGALPG